MGFDYCFVGFGYCLMGSEAFTGSNAFCTGFTGATSFFYTYFCGFDTYFFYYYVLPTGVTILYVFFTYATFCAWVYGLFTIGVWSVDLLFVTCFYCVEVDVCWVACLFSTLLKVWTGFSSSFNFWTTFNIFTTLSAAFWSLWIGVSTLLAFVYAIVFSTALPVVG